GMIVTSDSKNGFQDVEVLPEIIERHNGIADTAERLDSLIRADQDAVTAHLAFRPPSPPFGHGPFRDECDAVADDDDVGAIEAVLIHEPHRLFHPPIEDSPAAEEEFDFVDQVERATLALRKDAGTKLIRPGEMNDREITFLTARDGQQTEHHRFAPGLFDDAAQRLRHRSGFVQHQNDRSRPSDSRPSSSYCSNRRSANLR